MLCFRFLTPSYGRAGSILILLGTHVLVNIRSRSVKVCFAQSMRDQRPATCIGSMPSAQICVLLSRLIQGRSHGMTIITRLCSGNSNIDTVLAFLCYISGGRDISRTFHPKITLILVPNWASIVGARSRTRSASWSLSGRPRSSSETVDEGARAWVSSPQTLL